MEEIVSFSSVDMLNDTVYRWAGQSEWPPDEYTPLYEWGLTPAPLDSADVTASAFAHIPDSDLSPHEQLWGKMSLYTLIPKTKKYINVIRFATQKNIVAKEKSKNITLTLIIYPRGGKY